MVKLFRMKKIQKDRKITIIFPKGSQARLDLTGPERLPGGGTLGSQGRSCFAACTSEAWNSYGHCRANLLNTKQKYGCASWTANQEILPFGLSEFWPVLQWAASGSAQPPRCISGPVKMSALMRRARPLGPFFKP